MKKPAEMAIAFLISCAVCHPGSGVIPYFTGYDRIPLEHLAAYAGLSVREFRKRVAERIPELPYPYKWGAFHKGLTINMTDEDWKLLNEEEK